MGSIFLKTYTRAVPSGAEVITIGGKNPRRVARWRSGGRRIEAEVVTTPQGREVVRVKSNVYYAKYRNADGVIVVVPTGCRDREMAKQALAKLEKSVERVKAGVATHAEANQARRMAEPIGQHIDAYLATFAGSEMHRKNTGTYLRKIAVDCGWATLADLRRADLETWLAAESRVVNGKAKRSARSRNAYQTALVSFCNWLVTSARAMAENPFDRMAKAKLKTDPRRPRRALTIPEAVRLIEAARTAPERPAAKRNPRAGSKPARPAVKLSGADRALLYLTLVQTGLRIGELAEVRVRDVRLDGSVFRIELPARVGKNRREATIPLRRDLVDALRPRLEGKAPTACVFDVPSSLIARFNGDCKRAGIPKRDDRGRTVDVHSLRKTFNTWLALAGVAPRIAQELMRHGNIDLTMGPYMDAGLFDLAAAVESLPAMHQPAAGDAPGPEADAPADAPDAPGDAPDG
ncbi:MAG: tyrosine-type recombinase/integrase [Isosphaeraceae bacterium]